MLKSTRQNTRQLFNHSSLKQFEKALLNSNRIGGAPLKTWHILLILEIVVIIATIRIKLPSVCNKISKDILGS